MQSSKKLMMINSIYTHGGDSLRELIPTPPTLDKPVLLLLDDDGVGKEPRAIFNICLAVDKDAHLTVTQRYRWHDLYKNWTEPKGLVAVRFPL